MLALFNAGHSDEQIGKVTRKDLLEHMHGLKQRGMGDRTVYNHIARISALLKANGVTGLLSTSNKPRYEEKDVEAYTSAQLGTLFAEADRDERQLFEIFLATGFREQE